MPLNTLLRGTPQEKLTPKAAMVAAGVIAFLVAALDYFTPAEFDIGLFYAITIATCAWSASRLFLWIATTVSIALVFILARLGSPPQTSWLMVWTNRAFITLSLVVVAAIVNNWMSDLKAVETQRTFTRRLLETLDLAQVIIRKMDGTILFWSYGAELLYRWSAEEAVGKASHDLLRTDFGSERFEDLNRRLKRDWQWTGELRHIRKGGEPVWVVSHWTLEFSDLFQFPIVAQIDHNITELKLGDNRFRNLTELMPHLVLQVSPSGQALYTNQSWREYFGRDQGEVTSVNCAISQLVHPDDAPMMLEGWERALRSGYMEPWEIRYRRHDGLYRWFAGRTVAIRSDSGEILHWIMTATDFDYLKDTARGEKTQSDVSF